MVDEGPCGALFWLFFRDTPLITIVEKTRIVGCGRGDQRKSAFLGGKKPSKNDIFQNHILGCIGVNIITRARGGSGGGVKNDVFWPFLGSGGEGVFGLKIPFFRISAVRGQWNSYGSQKSSFRGLLIIITFCIFTG